MAEKEHGRDDKKKGGPVHRLPPEPAALGDTGDEEKGLLCSADDQLILPAATTQLEKVRNWQGGSTTMELEGERTHVPVGNTEMGLPPTTQPSESGTNSTATTKKEREHFDLKVSLVLITFSTTPLIDILFLHGPTAKLNLTLKLSAFIAFAAFISTTCLMFHTLKLMSIKPEQFIFIPKSQLRASQILFAIAVGSVFLAYILIAYSLLPKAYYFLPLSIVPSLLVGVYHFLYGAAESETDNGDIVSPAQSKALKKELKRATQLTLSLVSASFSGFVGVLLGIHHKAAILGAAYSHVKVSVYLLLGGGIAGVSALLLCRLLSSDDNNHRRRRLPGSTWQRAILAAANIVMLAMLASAVLIIAEAILHGLLVGAAFPVVAGAAAWLLVEFCTASGAETEDDAKAAGGTLYAIAVAVASLSFGAILAIFAGLLGGTVSEEHLRACTFFLASAFVASVSLGAVASGAAWAAKTKASTAFAAAVLACCGLGTLVLAALTLFYQITA